MRYTEKQAEAKARQIFTRFGTLIHAACSRSIVPRSFLAGFIGVEAGVDSNGQIIPEATRFEPHVYERLRAVRDGLIGSYNKITRADIAALSDDAIRNLATSWGITQIMGWHTVHNLDCTIADLRDPEKHLHYTVALILLTAERFVTRNDWPSVLRIWNTGSANGKTYHEDYVDNALLVKQCYEQISTNDSDFTPPTVQEPQQNPAEHQPETVTSEANETAVKDSQAGAPSSLSGAVEVKREKPDLFVQIGAAVTFLTATGLQIGTLVQQKLSELTPVQMLYLIAGLGVMFAAVWWYRKADKGAQNRTLALVDAAKDPCANTVKIN
jgi:hypothetical protein